MNEVNVTFVEVEVEPKVIKTDWTIKYGAPLFGIHKSCWKRFGIDNIFQYWLWKRKMRKEWGKENQQKVKIIK